MFARPIGLSHDPPDRPMYEQMKKVSLGFRLVYIGMLLIVFGILGGMLGLCVGAGIAGGGGLKAGGGLLLVVVGLMLLLLLGGSLMGFVGRLFCLAVPERAGAAKPMIMVSVVLEIAAFGLSLVGGIMNLTGKANPSVSMGLNGAQTLCSLLSAVLFLLFARTVADFIRRHDLAEAAMMVLKLWVMVIAIYAGSFIMVLVGGVAAGGGGGGGAMAGLACVSLVGMLVALVVALVALVRYITLLKEMSEATASDARRNRSKSRTKSRRRREEEEDEDEEEEEEEEEEDDDDEDEDDDDDDDDRRRRRRRR